MTCDWTQLSNTTNELQFITRLLLLLLSPAPGSAAPDEADGDTMDLVTGQGLVQHLVRAAACITA